MARTKEGHIYPTEHYSQNVSTIDAAQYIITHIDDDTMISEGQLHRLLFMAQTVLMRDGNVSFSPDPFINADSTPQATPLAGLLAPIKPNALSDSDTELYFDNESYIGGVITQIGNPDRKWLEYITNRYFDNMPDERLTEICTKSPILNRVASGETIEFNPTVEPIKSRPTVKTTKSDTTTETTESDPTQPPF